MNAKSLITLILFAFSCGGGAPRPTEATCIRKCITSCGKMADAQGCIDNCPEYCMMNPDGEHK